LIAIFAKQLAYRETDTQASACDNANGALFAIIRLFRVVISAI
jgi:hypothetical protein